jgi:hypothetical protein
MSHPKKSSDDWVVDGICLLVALIALGIGAAL